uniref:Uncharacterized protein n=1 Tax=Ditylum brightwellii TaxID=49249 RepID=A0A7S4R2V9_9STRA
MLTRQQSTTTAIVYIMFISSMISTVFAATMTSTFVSTPMISSASSSSSLKVNAFQQLTATTHLMIVNSNKSRSSEHRSCFGVVLAASKQASNNNDDDDNDIPLASPPHQKIKKRRFRKFMGAFYDLLSTYLNPNTVMKKLGQLFYDQVLPQQKVYPKQSQIQGKLP